MKLTMNIEGFRARYGLEKATQLCKTAGFDSADFSLGGMRDRDHIFNGDNYVAEAEAVKKVALENGLPITQTHTPFTFKEWKDPVAYEEFIIPTIKRSVEISAILGAEVAVVHPLHHFLYKGHEDEIYELNMDFYRSLIPICKEYNIKVGIENMFQTDPRRKHIVHDTCATIPDFVRYIDTLNSEYMVACLDIGHIGLPVSDYESWDFVRALGHDRLKALHVHDNDYRNDQHQLPYLGKIDWAQVTQALGEIDYTGNFTYEVSTAFVAASMDDEFAPVAIKYMADVGRHLCDLIDRNRPAK